MESKMTDDAKVQEFLRLIRESPKSLSMEEREVLVQRMDAWISRVGLRDLRLARARLADWMMSMAGSAAAADGSEAARKWQIAILRGDVIQAAIDANRRPLEARVRWWAWSDSTESRVAALSGLRKPV